MIRDHLCAQVPLTYFPDLSAAQSDKPVKDM